MERSKALVEQGESEFNAMMKAAEEVIAAQTQSTAIPRRFSAVTRQIWVMQARLGRTSGKRWKRLLHEQRFRAAYDFLLLRALDEPSLEPLCEFWTKAQEGIDFSTIRYNDADVDGEKPKAGRDRPRRRYRRRNASGKSAEGFMNAWIGLGGNFAESGLLIGAALVRLDEHEKIAVLRQSGVYRSPPWGVADQADFFNAVAELDTALPPGELLAALLDYRKWAGQGQEQPALGSPLH